jgi:hypothetical protein
MAQWIIALQNHKLINAEILPRFGSGATTDDYKRNHGMTA